MVRQWRNNEAHNAPISTDDEVNVAIKILVAMYLFVIGHSITDLEMSDGQMSSDMVPLHNYGMVADSIDVRKLLEEKRTDLLKRCIVQLANSGYNKKNVVFTKQRHCEAVYRIAADKGFVIDGDYRCFKQMIDGIILTNVPDLKADTVEKLNKGVYALPFKEWTPNGLLGKDLSLYNDIHLCGEKFLDVVEKNLSRE